MTSQPHLRPLRVLRHFASTRSLEVFALQASPILGGILGGFSFGPREGIRFGLLLLGSLALTAHVFVFNDWAGHDGDMRDPRRKAQAFARRDISRREVARLAVALLILSNVVFATLGVSTMLFGAAIATLNLLYSASPRFGKGTPVAASLLHLAGGTLHFLLGYATFHALDGGGVVLGLFFGLVFAGGHLNQEVRDYEGDLLNGIRTTAVVFGRRRAFLASLCIFTTAYALIAGLAALGAVPRLLLWSPLAWSLHAAWSLLALRRGLGFDTALWMQRRYRALFALTGLALLAN